MIKILNLISSPRGTDSVTVKLASAIIDRLKTEHSDIVVKERDLTKTPYPHLEGDEITAMFTPLDLRSAEQITLLQKSDEAITDLFEADIIIVGAPMYNFTIPTSLKAYFDRIVRAGITFSYTAEGPQGLVKNKKAYIAASTGSTITEEHMRKFDFVTPYILTVLGFIGIVDVTINRAEGLAIPELKEAALSKAIESIEL